MSKELEALERIKEKAGVEFFTSSDKDFATIETALKEKNELEKIVKQQIKTIGYYENLSLKNKLESDKKLKSLEIIKERVLEIDDFHKIIRCKDEIMLTMKEYDLLKEILL